MCAIEIEKEIEKYLSEIRNNLVCNRKLKKVIIEEIEGSVYDYTESKGVNDISEIYEHFGTPEEMARTYLSQVDPKKIRKATNVRKVVIIGVVAAIAIFVTYLALAFMDGHKNTDGFVEYYYVETSTDIIEYSPIEIIN